MQYLLLIFIFVNGLASVAQSISGAPTKQCATIRELVYAAANHQFETILLDREKGSFGYQTLGSWRFETTQFASLINWEGASKSFIDQSIETTDSSRYSRQFVAAYENITTYDASLQQFYLLNQQINDCKWFLNDSNILILKPLPDNKLPPSLPPGLLQAKVYPVTIINEAENNPSNFDLTIMTAIEKIKNKFSVYLIVEYSSTKSLNGKDLHH